ncbi:MAG: regulatory protein TetR [Aeromicrobium sp.]|nr:regulatory protein TetR [Aeromicrobium sp.]
MGRVTGANEPMTLPTATERGVTPDRIHAEAVKLFGAKGFATATMREIMTACSLTPGAFYNHYKSKEELLYQIIMAAHDQIRDAINEAGGLSASDPVARLSALTRAFSLWHCQNSEIARVANREWAELTGDMRRVAMQRRKELLDEFTYVIRAARDTSPAKARPVDPRVIRLTAVSVMDMMVAISEWFKAPGPWTAEELSEFYGDLVVRLVCA